MSFVRDECRSTRGLSEGQWRVMEALLARICPGGHGLPPPEATGARATMRRLVVGLSKDARFFLGVLLWVIEWGSFFIAGVFGRFSTMSSAKQDRVLERLDKSGWFMSRTTLKVVAVFCQIAYYSQPEVQRVVGYDARGRAVAKRKEAEALRAAELDAKRRLPVAGA